MSDANIIPYDPDKEPDEPALSATEEEAYENVKNDKAQDELEAAFKRVKNVKSAIENPEFYEIFIKPIRGNIEELKDALETDEKPRNVTFMQGEIRAYRKMMNFPETAVDAFNQKLSSLKETMPLFVSESEFARNVTVTFDRKEYRINIRGAK